MGSTNTSNTGFNHVMKVTSKTQFLDWVTTSTGEKVEKTMYGVRFQAPQPDDSEDIQRVYEGSSLGGVAWVTDDQNIWNQYQLGQLYNVGLSQLNDTQTSEWNQRFEQERQTIDRISQLVSSSSGSSSGSSGSST